MELVWTKTTEGSWGLLYGGKEDGCGCMKKKRCSVTELVKYIHYCILAVHRNEIKPTTPCVLTRGQWMGLQQVRSFF